MKLIHTAILFLFVFVLSNCSQPDAKHVPEAKHEFTNELLQENSPYLLQHAHNPVNWYPWGDKALNKAKEEGKPIIISIGYAACHWCHVMEQESFEDLEVAKIMNDNFVCIKVDREERPDIDQIYMDAAQLLTGKGGWPLNAIALPDGRPFFAGTYFPKEDWINVLQKITTLYQTDRAKINGIAAEVTQGINNADLSDIVAEKKAATQADVTTSIQAWRQNFDEKEGGYKSAPKFPLPKSWGALLNYYALTKDQKILDQVTLTLDKMAYGGIYDQIGGGFSRYSTDKEWKVPHFEKMLYDNAQLISLYSYAYKITQKPLYKRIITASIAFLERELLDKSGGFYASLDADAEGEEGKYYCWETAEIEALLGSDATWFINYYGMEAKGNWEGIGNILHVKDTALIKFTKRSRKESLQVLASSRKKLLKEREKRVKPGLDTKILTAWNALTLKAYLDAYQALEDEKYLKTALKSANFLLTTAKQSDYSLTRNYKDGKSSIPAFLDDYALVIDAFIALYGSTFDEQWLQHADRFMGYALANFYDQQSGYFFYASNQSKRLIARKMELSDHVIPASNSVMAKNLFYLGAYLYKNDYQDKSKHMLLGIKPNILKSGNFYSNWFELMLLETYPFYEVAIVGSDYKKELQQLHRQYLPQVILLGGNQEGGLELLENKLVPGQTRIYVCRNKACKLPVNTAEKALEQIR
ncbi:MAG: thioredoxin domain-containing protein [Flammeovirgaceae bacterium]